MGDFLFVNVFGDRKALRNLEEMPDVVRAILVEKLKYWTELLRDTVVEYIQARLKQVTGRLAGDVELEFVEDGLRIDGRVYIAGNPYARAQEKGAVVPAHIILPHNKVLVFMAASGDKIFSSRVFHPGGVIPPTHFMRDAYRFVSPQVTKGLRQSILKGLKSRWGSSL